MSIPKKIHLVWFGGERPKKFNLLVEKIKKINFDYEIFEWNDSNINFDLKNADLIKNCTNLGAKSDIFRFEVLNQYGGIYMDYDFIQVKKFDDLLHNKFFIGTSEDCKHESWNSIIGSTKKNKICENFLSGLSSTKPILIGETNRVMWETGPYYLSKVLENFKIEIDYSKYIGSYFFPFPAVERNIVKNLNESDINYCLSFKSETTYCIHIHTTSWQ